MPMNHLPTLCELIARAVGEVVPNAVRFGLAGAPGKVAVFHQVRETQVGCIPVDDESQFGQTLGHSVRGLVGQESNHSTREETHERQISRRILVDGVAQRAQRLALSRI